MLKIANMVAIEVPRVMTLPGKHMEQLRLAPSQMLPRGQMKKPLRDILRDISRRSKATVDMRGGPGGSIIFEGKGSVDSVRQALKEVAQQVGSKVGELKPILCDALLMPCLLSNSNLSVFPSLPPHDPTSLAAKVQLFRISRLALVLEFKFRVLLTVPPLTMMTVIPLMC